MRLHHSTLFLFGLLSSLSYGQAITLKNSSFEKAPVQITESNNPENKPFNDHNYNQVTEILDWGLPSAQGPTDYTSALIEKSFLKDLSPIIGIHKNQAIWLLNDRYKASQVTHSSFEANKAYTFTLSVAAIGETPGSVVLRVSDNLTVLGEKVVSYDKRDTTMADQSVSYTATGKEKGNIRVSFGVLKASDNVFIFDNARLVKSIAQKSPTTPVRAVVTKPTIDRSLSSLISFSGLSIALSSRESE